MYLDLEHMATDNTRVCSMDVQLKEFRPIDYLGTVKEFRRLVKHGGRLFLAGVYDWNENHAWLQQYDRTCLVFRGSQGRGLH